MLAASPQVYSSVSNSSVRLVAAAQDQGPCHTCAAFAVAAAAETAMASTLQVDVQQCSISVQALYFCPPGRPTRSCTAAWTLDGALEQLQQRGQSIPTAACLPYCPDYRQELSTKQLCSGSCSSPSQHAGKGQFTARQITSKWDAQRHIRQHGAVVSRFEVMSDFAAFFADKRNAQAVYRPKAGAQRMWAHAIVLVGYNNQQQYWLAKNSHGDTFGDGGLFKVAYGVSSVLTPFTGEAYGVMWTPHSIPAAMQLPVTPGPRPGCYLYKARSGDYLSKVAWLAGIPLDSFMLDNTDRVRDLDAPLQGVQLLLCNLQQGTVKVSHQESLSSRYIQAVKSADLLRRRWMACRHNPACP
ncbi:hypothetical protein COO60DRAFT_73096 [Scenedesmus sp. NREL 46B-D3]|nr:hypothetical protein COO60DRAFT_73096 [Scenedesmus sp. NREL 46B-D3]